MSWVDHGETMVDLSGRSSATAPTGLIREPNTPWNWQRTAQKRTGVIDLGGSNMYFLWMHTPSLEGDWRHLYIGMDLEGQGNSRNLCGSLLVPSISSMECLELVLCLVQSFRTRPSTQRGSPASSGVVLGSGSRFPSETSPQSFDLYALAGRTASVTSDSSPGTLLWDTALCGPQKG